MSAGLRRGLVGVVPAGADHAGDLTQWHRATRLDVRPFAWRADRRESLRSVARVLACSANREQLLTRPGHEEIARQAGLSLKTVQRRIDDMHELRWLITTEVGTTARIRAGRLRGGHDPHEGNRAQEYHLVIPATVTLPHADQAKELSVHPSPVSPKERGGTTNSRFASHGTTHTRARNQRCDPAVDNRPRAAGKRDFPRQAHRVHRGRPAWQDQARQVTAVWRVLPAALTQRLAGHEADRLATAIAAELLHRDVAELGARIAAHWPYWRGKLSADLVRSPIAAATRMIRRDYDCPDVRCEDGHQLDTGAPCAACAVRRTDQHTTTEPTTRPTPSPRRITADDRRRTAAARAAGIHAYDRTTGLRNAMTAEAAQISADRAVSAALTRPLTISWATEDPRALAETLPPADDAQETAARRRYALALARARQEKRSEESGGRS